MKGQSNQTNSDYAAGIFDLCRNRVPGSKFVLRIARGPVDAGGLMKPETSSL